MSSSSTSRIVQLARIISTNTESVEQYLQSQGIPSPSFDENATKNMTLADKNVERQRIEAVSAAAELQDLLQGPHAALTPSINATGLEAVAKWKVPTHVPRDGEISYSDLALRVGLQEQMLRRLVRVAITLHRCFQEKREGFVSHSAASRLLADSPDMLGTAGMMFEESWHAFAKTCDAIERFDCSQEPAESAFSLAFCPGKNMWEYYAEHPEKGQRFNRAMEMFALRPGFSVSFLVDDYPWSSLGPGSKVVDVGGGQGHASIAISNKFPHLQFVVQDLPDVIDAARRRPDIPNAVQFMEHDFLTEQPLEADLYLLRWVLHDWPDKYVVRILRNMIPKLRPGAKVVINDSCMPKLGSIPNVLEKRVRAYDMSMLALFNSKEREERDWHELLAEADPRFGDIRSWTPPGAVLSIIEATWKEQ